MPSWNIHTAHVERLASELDLPALGIADFDAFLFGNYAPDVYVGYMVTDASRKIEYRETHLAKPDFIPKPNASLFYERYVAGKPACELTLGAWMHLLCDHYYNKGTIEFIARIGVQPGEQTRIRKQGDFDLFGRTLEISHVPRETEELLRQAASFEQYAIDAPDVRKSIAVARGIVDRNTAEHVEGTPDYSLFGADFFQSVFDEVDEVLREALTLHASGGDPARFGRP
ncbi:MAG: hypothetical protein Q4B54_01900 [Coriobacteriales bacterium]|nr:hypothetical protein [Coriobacteriales bacterium]